MNSYVFMTLDKNHSCNCKLVSRASFVMQSLKLYKVALISL